MWMGRSSAISYPDDVADDREDTVGRDDPDDREHHRRGRGLTDRGRVAPRLHPAETARERDQDAEDDALSDTETDAREADRVPRLHPVLRRRLRQHADGHGRAPEDTDQVRIETEERHHEAEREHARQDQE